MAHFFKKNWQKTKSSNLFQVVDVPTIDNRECEGWHRDKGIRVIIYDEMMCAGYYEGGKDSCQGDSGGPLMTEVEGRWTLIGIVSAGYSCAKRGQPGIYHRVAHTSDWISYSVHSWSPRQFFGVKNCKQKKFRRWRLKTAGQCISRCDRQRWNFE